MMKDILNKIPQKNKLFISDDALYIWGLDVLRKDEYIKENSIDLELNFPPFPFTLKWDKVDTILDLNSKSRIEGFWDYQKYINFLLKAYTTSIYKTLKTGGHLVIISKMEIDFSTNQIYSTPTKLLEWLTSSWLYSIIDVLNWVIPNSMRCTSWYKYRTVWSHRTTYSTYQVLVFEKLGEKNKKTMTLKDKKDNSEDYTTEFLNENRQWLTIDSRSTLWNKYKNVAWKNQLASDELLWKLIKLYSKRWDIVSDSFGWIWHHWIRALELWRKTIISELLTKYIETFKSEYKRIKKTD